MQMAVQPAAKIAGPSGQAQMGYSDQMAAMIAIKTAATTLKEFEAAT